MTKPRLTTFSKIITFMLLLLGIGIIGVSALYASSFLALLGLAIIFWGTLLLYLTPSKHVPLTLLNASTETTTINIERLISELKLTEKGIYLPPENLTNIDLSLVFIPKTPKTPLPTPEDSNERLFTNEKTGVLVTPPGASLSRLFEEELGFSFRKTDFNQLQNKLPKLLVEEMELAKSVKIQIQDNIITVEIVESVLNDICRQTDSQPKTHRQVGCLLSSAIACALAKATGKFVTIQNETRNQETETTHIEYQIFEGETKQFKTMQLSPLTLSNECARLNNTEVKRSVSDNVGSNVLDVEITPSTLDHLKKYGDVFILTDFENPQYSYCKIEGIDANHIIEFEKFVLIWKADNDSQNRMSNSGAEFIAETFDVTSPLKLMHCGLASYVEKSGFSNVDDWIRTLKAKDEIPEWSTGNKIFYLYHIQAMSAFERQREHAKLLEG